MFTAIATIASTTATAAFLIALLLATAASAATHNNSTVIESLSIRSLSDSSVGIGLRLATIDAEDGSISAQKGLRFDKDQLKVTALSSFSAAGLEIRSDVNLSGNILRDFVVEPETEITQIVVADSVLRDVAIENATATNLSLEDVAVESLRVKGDAQIVGSLYAGTVMGAGPYVDISDERLKEKVEYISDGRMSILDSLEHLQAVSYELHDPRMPLTAEAVKLIEMGMAPPPPPRQIGFLAQDVEAVFPELVSTDKDGYKGVQYARFVPLLVEALMETREENAGLLYAIDLLERRLAVLEEGLQREESQDSTASAEA